MTISEGTRPSQPEQPGRKRVGEPFRPFEDLVFPALGFIRDHPVKKSFVFDGIHGELVLVRHITYGRNRSPEDDDKLPFTAFSVFTLNEEEYRKLNNYAMEFTSIREDGEEEKCYLSLGDEVTFDALKRRSGVFGDGRVRLQNMNFQRAGKDDYSFDPPFYESNIASVQARIVEKPLHMRYY